MTTGCSHSAADTLELNHTKSLVGPMKEVGEGCLHWCGEPECSRPFSTLRERIASLDFSCQMPVDCQTSHLVEVRSSSPVRQVCKKPLSNILGARTRILWLCALRQAGGRSRRSTIWICAHPLILNIPLRAGNKPS